MNCEECQNQIGAAHDGEMDDAARIQLEAHLAECGECRGLAEGLEYVDALLRRSLRPMKRRASELAEEVTLKLSGSFPQPASQRNVQWPRMTAAVLAGFLIACLVFQPWRDQPDSDGLVPAIVVGPDEEATSELHRVNSNPQTAAATVAHLRAATGPIDVRFPDQVEWVTYADVPTFQCPGDTCVKTPSGSLCEFETTSGCVVRMRDDTEVKVHSPDRLQLSEGHVWCNVPESGRLLVTTERPIADSQEAAMSADVFGPAVMMQCVNPDPPTVTSCSGLIDVANGSERRTVAAGGSIQLVSGALVSSIPADSPLLSEAWMHPLLIRNGFDDPELQNRVDALLARIGDMKMSLLYEQQIRGLGEHAALPLLKFVQASQSDVDQERREAAARILADIGPVWMITEFLDLLNDDNPRVRAAGDRALVRLTGRESGTSGDDWATDPNTWNTVREDWRNWWEQSGKQFSQQPAGGFGDWEADSAELMLKARVP